MTEQLTGLVAVDAGGTSTRTVVLDPAGHCLGYAVAGSSNPVAVGPETAAASVAQSVRVALEKARIPSTATRLVVLAMAGAGSPSVSAEVSSRLADVGLEAPVVFESDLLATYFSGTHRADGYAVISGTGAGAIRVEQGRQVAVADGLGWLLGDEGSGFWIGHRVVRAALADLDGRGPATELTPLLLGRLGVAAPSDPTDREPILALVRALYAGPPVRLADHARLAFEVDGDMTADRILDAAAAALERTLDAVRSPTVSGPVVLGGGILGRGDKLVDRLVGARGAAEVHVVADGVLGVCVLALRRTGTTVDAAAFQRLATSLAAVR
ncbi:N-acetylglucosamine kinase [Marmoricola sp. URHB0036]|uniref:N-acetylglucosamine kinase n=1 Tax=Marmoricola sp. URHB0036 TaxID=1298863 RepID=UPI000427318B|nr:BadF/BadG/BcrA/BcrD ATPase family protein [Marmoricola sp. URHB0036]